MRTKNKKVKNVVKSKRKIKKKYKNVQSLYLTKKDDSYSTAKNFYNK